MPSAFLQGAVVPRPQVSPGLVQDLYALHATCYDGTDPARFAADLAEKHWVLLLRETDGGRPVGFSTQQELSVPVAGRPVRVLFSGDTIIHPDYWGTQELVRTWCRFAGQRLALGEPLYWFLISKGYRTYLYLPLFFLAFSPCHDRPTPAFEQQLLLALGRAKFPGAFDPQTGLIAHAEPHDRLRPDLDGAGRRQHNPHVAFFLERNPHYTEGVELACVARIAPDNMRGAAQRELEAGMRADGER